MALLTAALVLAVPGVASAKTHLAAGTVLALDQAAVAASPAQEFSVSPAARRHLVALEAAGNMPNPNADMQMWGGGGNARAMSFPSKRSDINRFARGIIRRTSSIALSLTRSAMRFIGTPYVFGGTSPSGFDCSGYVQHVFAMLGIALPRTADAQYYAGHRPVGGVEVGDLVFFQTYLPGPSHVGIYLGGGRFVSASGHRVQVSSLSDRYWAARYLGAKRVVSGKQTRRVLAFQ
jgi:cell wall-associated NlpC family hydrolase